MTDLLRLSPSHRAADLVAQPLFWQALVQQAQDLLTVHSAIPAEVHYLADIRRWVLIQMAIALHLEHQRDATQPMLSPKSLLAALDGTGIASRNTVQAFMRELARVQFTAAPAQSAIRQRAPKVSEKSEKLMQIYLDIHLRALDTVDGGGRRAFLHQWPRFLSYLQPAFARRICKSSAWYTPPPAIQGFTNAASGSSILHDLVLATEQRAPDAEGKIWIGAVSAAVLAKRYQVSPAHVARMLSRARGLGAMGWGEAARRKECWLSASLAQAYLLWQGEKLSVLSDAFCEAAAAFLAAQAAT